MATTEGDEQPLLSNSWRILERMPADDVHAIAHDMKSNELTELARVVGVPRVVLSRDSSAARVLRNRLRGNDDRAKLAVSAMVRSTTDLAIAALGPDRSDAPSHDDLVDVLPGLLEQHGARRVALMLSFAVDDAWAAAEPAQQLLDSDQRLSDDALGAPIDDTVAPTRSQPKPSAKSTDRAPREKKAKRGRSTPTTERPSYKRKKKSDHGGEPTGDTAVEAPDPPPITVNGGALTADRHPRDVRIVGSYPALDRSDQLVGKVVLANISFDGPVSGDKVRPCVVIAASGADALVVRPCYSEGGRRAGDFRAVAISDPDRAGLDRNSYVSHEERLIARSSLTGELGWLSTTDWNQL